MLAGKLGENPPVCACETVAAKMKRAPALAGTPDNSAVNTYPLVNVAPNFRGGRGRY